MIIIITLLVLVAFYFYLTKEHNFFKKRGIKYIKPFPIFGTNWRPAFGFISYFDHFQKIYNENQDERIFGTFDLTKPLYIINDLELAKQITIKGFDNFVDRRVTIDVKGDPVGGNMLAFVRGEQWRHLRGVLTPAFTGNKMRYLFHVINDCAESTINFLNEKTKSGPYSFLAYNFFTKLTNDLIASTAFGIEEDSFRNEANEFYRLGVKMNNFGIEFFFKWMFYSVAPKVATFFRLKLMDTTSTDYFMSIIDDKIQYRQKNNYQRPDIIQLLMESGVPREDIMGQSIQFFAAGFDTSAALFQFMSYQLALNPDIQNKLRKEVDDVMSKMKGNPITYDAIHEMKYMNCVMSETLRMHPPLVWMERACTQPFTLQIRKDHNIHFKIGDHVAIPVSGIHYDSKYFKSPNTFMPERFIDNNNTEAYMAFGQGPRKCIAERLALMQTKIFFYHLLLKYELKTNSRTEIPIQYRKGIAFLKPANGIWLDLQLRSDVATGTIY